MKYPNDPILATKEKSHGDYKLNAYIAQQLKDIIEPSTTTMDATIKEALDLICTKLGRICAGDPTYKDHWDDIAGYARLIASQLK